MAGERLVARIAPERGRHRDVEVNGLGPVEHESTPYLVLRSLLPPDVQELDPRVALAIPDVLARVGLRNGRSTNG